jgi:sugar-specific transcriptional regulator TrmB
MSKQNAIGALKRLGLSNYEARVFVALQELGTATTAEISDVSEVPRSQVYGAADELAEHGLAEVIKSSPKRYRPVSLSAARTQFHTRLEREQERAFENLNDLRQREPDSTRSQDVSTLRGRQPINDRIVDLVDGAENEVVLVAPSEASLSTTIGESLRKRGRDSVGVTVLTAEEAVADRFAGDPVYVFVMDEDNPADFAGRALMIDGTTVLLAVATESDEPVEEEAMWTAETSIGRILAQFMQSGMESGIDSEGRPDRE